MDKKYENIMKIFENISEDTKMIESIIQIQNNINIYGNSKIIGVSSPKDDIHSLVVAKAIAEVYAAQNQSAIIIDCNMYNPLLQNYYKGLEITLNDVCDENTSLESYFTSVSENLSVITCKKTVYPTEVLLSKEFHELLKEAEKRYNHVILILPAILNNQDILTLKNDLTSCVLVARKKQTKRKQLFDTIELLKENNLPYVGTIFMK